MGLDLGNFDSKTKFLAFENLQMNAWFTLNGFLCQQEVTFPSEQWCTTPNENREWMCMKCMEWMIGECVVYFDWGIMMWNCGNCYVICEKRWWNSQTKMQAKLVSKSNHLKNRVLKNFPFQGSDHKNSPSLWL